MSGTVAYTSVYSPVTTKVTLAYDDTLVVLYNVMMHYEFTIPKAVSLVDWDGYTPMGGGVHMTYIHGLS